MYLMIDANVTVMRAIVATNNRRILRIDSCVRVNTTRPVLIAKNVRRFLTTSPGRLLLNLTLTNANVSLARHF